MAGVKRGAEALFQKDWENTTEASEPALSDASAFPATTEASIRCKRLAMLYIKPFCQPPALWGSKLCTVMACANASMCNSTLPCTRLCRIK